MSKKQTDGPMSARRDKYIHKAMPVKAVFALYLGEPRSDFSGEKGRLRSPGFDPPNSGGAELKTTPMPARPKP